MKADDRFGVAEDEEQDLDQSLGELELGETVGLDEQGPADEPLAELRYREVVDTIRTMLEGTDVDLAPLTALADEERAALEALQDVIRGRERDGSFMYAEERLLGLQHVLARLQPLLSVGALHDVLNESLAEVVDGMATLRDRLELLEEAQEEIFHAPEELAAEADADDADEGEGEGEAAAAVATAAARAEAAEDAAARKSGRAHHKPKPQPAAAEDDAAEPPPARSTVWDPDDREGGPP